MQKKSNFIFQSYTWDAPTGNATFHYKVEHKDEEFHFTETLTFPQPFSETYSEELVQKCLKTLHLALGVSYYKLFCPKTILIESFKLNQEQARFWETVYTKGLGEFFYQNKLDFRGLISFPFVEGVDVSPVSVKMQDRALLGIGGGKDSIVAGELLKKHKKPFSAFVINDHPIRAETIEILGAQKIVIKRIFDPLLFTLNKRTDAYNGHVPVSTHYACIGFMAAVLYDFNAVIVGNEHSASYGNTEYLGEEVNHQWSKSLEFEKMFQAYTAAFLTKDIVYFSLLRPYTELVITQIFSQYPQYFHAFSSCNKNFKITMEGSDKLWCGECPKCAFAFVMLSAFLPKQQLVSIFGQNLFEKESLLKTYKELLGVESIKPFDCVGTPDEVTVAFYLASRRKEYNDSSVMQYFETEILPGIMDMDSLQREVFEKSNAHLIPEWYREVLRDDN